VRKVYPGSCAFAKDASDQIYGSIDLRTLEGLEGSCIDSYFLGKLVS
jgi:hypothetical protein